VDMVDLTLDVWILLSGYGGGNRKNSAHCKRLMNQMRDISNARLVLDNGDFIKHVYDTKLGEQTYARKWVYLMIDRGKVNFVDRISIRSGLIGELRKNRFHKDDDLWIRAAAASFCKIIVTHDVKFFLPKVKKLLRKQWGIRPKRASSTTC